MQLLPLKNYDISIGPVKDTMPLFFEKHHFTKVFIRMEISRIPSNSETFGVNQTYQTWDYYPQAGINYYCLNNLEKNGDRGDSRVIMVNFARESMPFWLEQNKDELILHAGALSQNETVELYDVSGRLTNTFVFSNGLAVLNKQNLAKGLYNLRSIFNQSFKFTKVIVY